MQAPGEQWRARYCNRAGLDPCQDTLPTLGSGADKLNGPSEWFQFFDFPWNRIVIEQLARREYAETKTRLVEHLYDWLSRCTPKLVNELIALKQGMIDGLEECYGAITITTRSQHHMTLLQFWLTIVFGASGIGFSAASIATWYYRSGLWTVLGWTIGAALVSGLGLALMLKGKVE
jgi:hypothetical protein